MGNIQYLGMDNFFTSEDIEQIKKCSQIRYSNIHFFTDSIWTFSGKQEIKALLCDLFREKSSHKVNNNSKDNWYAYLAAGNQVNFACLFDDMERSNAVIKTLNYIKRSTGFHVPYTLLRFDLDLEVENEVPQHQQIDDNTSVDFAFRALVLCEKYMHFLGMQASMLVDDAFSDLNFPQKNGPAILTALITDEPDEQWHFYMLFCSQDLNLSQWELPDELIT